VTVAAENAAAALEVMGRFAVEPAALLWLPPTMAPCSTATVDGFLEYPNEAFGDYRRAGVGQVVCEEKHMGSRMVVLARRDSSGAAYTRTGRPFFTDATVNAGLVTRVAAAADRAGLFDDLGTDWLLIDAELLPWSAKATGLLREQYASVAAAARGALPAVLSALEAAAGRGLDVAALRERMSLRHANAERFTSVYRRYCWPTEGLDGVRVAPFAVLASQGATHAARDRGWHLSLADRLAAADPDLVAPTQRRVVDLADEEAVRAATQWWLSLTEAGGEGMVVKPYAGLVRTANGGLVHPGIKCRGRDYLRIIYGPDYAAPDTLARLRNRGLARKRAMALREHQLGLHARSGGRGRAAVAHPRGGLRDPGL
jgi:hypothetical protein